MKLCTSALLVLACQCATAIGGTATGAELVPVPCATQASSLEEESDLPLLVLDEPQDGSMLVESLVYDPITGAASHFKQASIPIVDAAPIPLGGDVDARAFDFDGAVKASLALRDGAAAERTKAEDTLEQAVDAYMKGSTLDRTTPADGHCLLHALMRGGIINTGRIPLSLTVSELRVMALNVATLEEIRLAAISTGNNGVSVATYRRGMLHSMWGGTIFSSLVWHGCSIKTSPSYHAVTHAPT